MPKVMEIVSYRTSGGREAFVAASREIDGWAQRQQICVTARGAQG